MWRQIGGAYAGDDLRLSCCGANYWKFAKPQGRIETKYTGMGEHEVSLFEFDVPDTVWEKYEIWYPSNLEQPDQAYPVVVIAKAFFGADAEIGVNENWQDVTINFP